jgi:hypothetical protein
MRLQRDEGICNFISLTGYTCNLETMPRGLDAKYKESKNISS